MQRPTSSTVSLFGGIWWVFEGTQPLLTIGGSLYSGKEYVFIGDELVIDTRTLRLSSKHEFEHDGHHYEVRIKQANILKVTMACSVLCDGELIGSIRSDSSTLRSISYILPILAGIFGGTILSLSLGLPFGAVAAVAILAAALFGIDRYFVGMSFVTAE